MRVVVNRLCAAGQKTGVGHYASELLRCLPAAARTDSIDVFPGPWTLWAKEAASRARSGATAAAPSNGATAGMLPRLRKAAWTGLRRCSQKATAYLFRSHCARHPYDVYHEPNFIPLPSDLPTVTTILDLSVLLHPNWHPADRVAHFDKHFNRGLARSQHFLAISEWGRDEIIRTLGIPREQVSCTPMGVRPCLSPLPAEEVATVLKKLGLPSRYLLAVGTIEPRKNILRLLRTYCALPGPLRDAWPLVLAGGWGWNSAEVAEYYESEAKHQGVQLLGYVAEEHLAALYNGARALVFPSFYEGFGLPPLEMLACGGAVLASTAGAVAETVGGQAHLIDPDDFDGWRDGLARVVTDDDWWHSLRDGAIDHAAAYSWERCAAETIKAYQLVAGVEPSFTIPLAAA
jgi:alpha-1,3-rhamnosyl/mannosyltransferase